MIIMHLKGGLGNQLFQYAFARSLSYNLKKELFLDISHYSHNEKRKHVIFGLNAFNIKGIVGNYPYVEKTSVGLDYNSSKKICKYVQEVPNTFPYDIYDENAIEKLKDIKLPAYFEGYFQKINIQDKSIFITETFFKENNKIIHEDLEYSLPFNEEYVDIIKDMDKYDSIALHVRRGDYLDYPNFGLCTVEYYEKAIEKIVSKVENPKFYIFSEDMEWIKKNIKIDYPTKYINFYAKKDSVCRGYAELLNLMAQCDNFIIANSTFSYWASFLGKNKEKIIITPKPWFIDRSFVEVDTIDNIKTINIKNDFQSEFNQSKKIIYKMNEENFVTEKLTLNNKNFYELLDLSLDSKLILKTNVQSNQNEKIIHLSLKTNHLNGLQFYFKTTDNQNYSEKNSRKVFFYENEEIDYYAKLPDNSFLDEILIKPYITDYSKNILVIKDIVIKELNS